MMTKSKKKNPKTHLIELVERYFPGKSQYLMAMLATYCTLGLKDISQPIPLFIVGRPSSRKSTLCEIMSILKDDVVFGVVLRPCAKIGINLPPLVQFQCIP